MSNGSEATTVGNTWGGNFRIYVLSLALFTRLLLLTLLNNISETGNIGMKGETRGTGMNGGVLEMGWK